MDTWLVWRPVGSQIVLPFDLEDAPIDAILESSTS